MANKTNTLNGRPCPVCAQPMKQDVRSVMALTGDTEEWINVGNPYCDVPGCNGYRRL
ncbi:hypothetical protein [Nocardia callitridis]|uniref:Uncharacterized protein n=1 Tax=Nocardia callitridis TaxID=648753 RepID=A0ABP9K905_9NOCA